MVRKAVKSVSVIYTICISVIYDYYVSMYCEQTKPQTLAGASTDITSVYLIHNFQ